MIRRDDAEFNTYEAHAKSVMEKYSHIKKPGCSTPAFFVID